MEIHPESLTGKLEGKKNLLFMGEFAVVVVDKMDLMLPSQASY
jgi:hypothetical protein